MRANVSQQHDINPAVLCGIYSQGFSQTISWYYIICTRVALSLISVKVVLEKQFPGKIYRTLALVEIVLNLPGNMVRIITKNIYLLSFSAFFIASSDHI